MKNLFLRIVCNDVSKAGYCSFNKYTIMCLVFELTAFVFATSALLVGVRMVPFFFIVLAILFLFLSQLALTGNNLPAIIEEKNHD